MEVTLMMKMCGRHRSGDGCRLTWDDFDSGAFERLSIRNFSLCIQAFGLSLGMYEF